MATVDGAILQARLISFSELKSFELPEPNAGQSPGRVPQPSPTHEDIRRALFEAVDAPNQTDIIRRIRAIVTEQDREDLESQDLKIIQGVYSRLYLAAVEPSLTALKGQFFAYHNEYAARRYRGQNTAKIVRDLGPPPWLQVSEVLQRLGLPYSIRAPDIDSELPSLFRFALERTSDRTFVPGDRLSTGERALLSIFDLIFSSPGQPRLLLLDDIDGFLHPPVLKNFIRMLEETLPRTGGFALVATHSPVTVQVARGASCFTIRRYGADPEPIQRQDLINLLTGGELIVSDNLRTVFVEGQDHAFYTQVFTRMSSRGAIEAGRPLRFASPSLDPNSGGAGHHSVRAIVPVLQQAGYGSQFAGLVDADAGGDPLPEGVFAIGRYSVENYWTDPLNLYAWFLDRAFAQMPPSLDFGLLAGESHEMRTRLSAAQRQAIVDHFGRAIRAIIEPSSHRRGLDLSAFELVEISGGEQLRYPSFLLRMRGKDLLSAVRNLNGSINKGVLSRQFELGAFWPADLTNLMQELSSV